MDSAQIFRLVVSREWLQVAPELSCTSGEAEHVSASAFLCPPIILKSAGVFDSEKNKTVVHEI